VVRGGKRRTAAVALQRTEVLVYRIIDTHAHLDELDDVDLMLDEARESGVAAVIAVGSDYGSNVKVMEISQRRPGLVYPALGLHPCELGNLLPVQVERNLRFIDEHLSVAVAVGEVGLDYDKRVLRLASRELQREVFGHLLRLAKKHGRPVSIHSRYAWKDALQMVRDAGVDKAVFHWFTGFSSVLKAIVEEGYCVSATPAAEYHEEHRRAVREVPLNRLLLETDCPVTYGREIRYMSRPADLRRSLRAAAELRQVDEALIAEQTTRNAIDVFSLDMVI